MALHEARKSGVRPFCVTIDDRSRDYLPYLFGGNAWMLVRNAGELPAKLPLLYARLTA
jgi:nitric oxide reductase NorD protein